MLNFLIEKLKKKVKNCLQNRFNENMRIARKPPFYLFDKKGYFNGNIKIAGKPLFIFLINRGILMGI